ncbi:hypothetical protein AVEN_212700-1 [Araneus ventricosus]|uniref:G-protein coupled receptors family 1 profile domain-containing protein n=1 Tax=Araneus ventricosus TaxID=182803 RepID=A0A4Y2BWV5_ARAVE|nr:hypothetical protein AVEN_212700-1 [Araneus ventricosus]
MSGLLFNILCWFGFAVHSHPSKANWVKTFVIQFLLVVTYLDTFVMYIFVIGKPMFKTKVVLQNIMFISSSILLMFLMIRKRYRLTSLFRDLRFMHPPNWTKKTNIVVCCVFCVPFFYALTMVTYISILEKDYMFRFYWYGCSIEDKTTKFLMGFAKMFAFSILYPTLTNLVAMVYSAFCYLCSQYLRGLCSEIEKNSPESFTVVKQIEILKRRLRVVKILEEMQEIFSTASFVICSANFTSCLTDMSQIISYASQNIGPTIISVLFSSTSTVASIVCIFLSAGQVPIEMKRISTIARRLLEQKAIWGIAEKTWSLS